MWVEEERSPGLGHGSRAKEISAPKCGEIRVGDRNFLAANNQKNEKFNPKISPIHFQASRTMNAMPTSAIPVM